MATGHTTAMAVAIAAAVLALPRASVAADALASEATAMSHVRSSNLAIVALIRQAAERSVTFRGLVAAIDASDSIVFVEAGACGHGVRACFVSVSATKSNRYMRVVVDTHKADTDLMGSIGHELRHTLEVIAEPGIRSDAAKYFFYESIGTRGITGPRETRAAITAGDAVRSEISRSTRQSHPH